MSSTTVPYASSMVSQSVKENDFDADNFLEWNIEGRSYVFVRLGFFIKLKIYWYSTERNNEKALFGLFSAEPLHPCRIRKSRFHRVKYKRTYQNITCHESDT